MCLFVYVKSESLALFAVCACVCAAATAAACVCVYISDKQAFKTLSELSRLIDYLNSCGYKAVFPEFEDSMPSRLQSGILRLNETLVSRGEAVEREKNEIKSLVSDISHQLKTPVATLKTYGDLLTLGNVSEERRQEYLSQFSLALEKLVFLTDSLIKMSRLESGVIVLKGEPVTYTDAVLDAVMSVCTHAEEKNIEILLSSDCGARVFCDRRWTAEALFNILDNAVKYSNPDTKIDIFVSELEMFVRADICDSGPGIPKDELNDIFKRFYRGSNASLAEGSGIGLYLSRKIVSDQGGYIKVRSDSSGTVFSIFMPRCN